jgi:hypothetical protein
MKLNIDVIERGMQSLKELKNVNLLNVVDHLSDGSYRLKPNIFPNSGAVYAFWWTGSLNRFMAEDVNRVISFKGPNGRKVEVEFSDKWINQIHVDGKIPLYVGKTADSLHKRLSLHLQLKTRRGLSIGEKALMEERKTTSNQVRDRIERMFLDEADTRCLMLHNIGLSYVLLNGDQESANRFYLEDRAIGEFLPLFNIDIER